MNQTQRNHFYNIVQKLEISRIFANFCQHFRLLRTFSNVFGCARTCLDAFRCVRIGLEIFGEIFRYGNFSGRVLVRIWRSYVKTDVKIRFLVIFCSRLTYSELRTTKNRPKNVRKAIHFIQKCVCAKRQAFANPIVTSHANLVPILAARLLGGGGHPSF